MISEGAILFIMSAGFLCLAVREMLEGLSSTEFLLIFVTFVTGLISVLLFVWSKYSKSAKDEAKRIESIRETPTELLEISETSIRLGDEVDLLVPVFLPDSVRKKHVHVIGATGSGKTESVILNFLKQDIDRGLGAVILDAKGDDSFITTLRLWLTNERLKIFDLSSESSISYDPLNFGTPLEGAQRLFSSFTWSEEYYKAKALSALQKLFQSHFEKNKKNPSLCDLEKSLASPAEYIQELSGKSYDPKVAERDFQELAGLRDQIGSLTVGHLGRTLSGGTDKSCVELSDVHLGKVLYFRLQSLLSPQAVSSVGKLLINNLNYLTGKAHRQGGNDARLIPIYLDEFATFASPEFADLISKARSANFALHFSHQSIGDLMEVSEGFINRITDNSATKIVMRINDPDSADFFARSFGTRLYQKLTQRVTNADDEHATEIMTDGTQRDAHQFRASPDLLKTLPTGYGSVLIAHGQDTKEGASHVFKIKFPRLEKEKLE